MQKMIEITESDPGLHYTTLFETMILLQPSILFPHTPPSILLYITKIMSITFRYEIRRWLEKKETLTHGHLNLKDRILNEVILLKHLSFWKDLHTKPVSFE